MRTLNEIAITYNTDKSSLGHNYTQKYASYFSHMREKNLNLFEIGIFNGSSLKTWKEYFPNSKIFGLDIKDASSLNDDRITTIVGSQYDKKVLENVNSTYGPFDIIIDDGSHRGEHMKFSFETLFPLLKPNGLYIIEDLHCCYWAEFNENGENHFMNFLKGLMDAVNGNGKCGYADITKLNIDAYYNEKNTKGELTYYERSIEFIHLYRSIVFIKKY